MFGIGENKSRSIQLSSKKRAMKNLKSMELKLKNLYRIGIKKYGIGIKKCILYRNEKYMELG